MFGFFVLGVGAVVFSLEDELFAELVDGDDGANRLILAGRLF